MCPAARPSASRRRRLGRANQRMDRGPPLNWPGILTACKKAQVNIKARESDVTIEAIDAQNRNRLRDGLLVRCPSGRGMGRREGARLAIRHHGLFLISGDQGMLSRLWVSDE